ncbi:MAG: hypothetical protein LBG80_06660 [Bacteroidales bacterium]|jgi:hypothetical protein|nr:hypothetical protein [Bacteroidales bacterium]
MKSSKPVILPICLILVIIFLSLMIFRTIMRPEKFKNICKARKAEVVLKLENIRAMQNVYKSEKGSYANTFDQLRDFWNNGKKTIVVKEGTVPDTLTEAEALKLKIIRRDTLVVDARDEILKEIRAVDSNQLFDIDKFDLIPYSQGERFQIAADTIVRANIPVYVYEVIAQRKQYLKGLDDDPRVKNVFLGSFLYSGLQEKFLGPNFDYREEIKDIILGSLVEPSTNGNWE